MVSHVALQDLFKWVLTILCCKEALQADDARYLWNALRIKGSELEDKRLKDSCCACYSPKSELQMHHLVNMGCKRTHGQQCVELETSDEQFQASHDLDKHKAQLLQLQPSERHFLLSGWEIEAQIGHEDSGPERGSYSDDCTIVLARA